MPGFFVLLLFKMKFKFFLHLPLIGFAIAVLLSSSACSHYYYGATVHHNALLEKKNEVVAVAAAGISDETSFGSLNIAYAPTHKLGVYGQYYHAWSGSSFNSGGNGTYGDIAVGLFDTLKGHFRYEMIAGLGNARVLNVFESNKSVENKFNKYYGQINLGYRTAHFDVCLALRGAVVNQYKISPDDTMGISTLAIADYNTMRSNPTRLYFEPGIYISGGLHNWKLQLGLGGASWIGANPETYYDYQKAFLSLGLKVNFTATK